MTSTKTSCPLIGRMTVNIHYKAMENAFRAGFVKAGGDPESFSEFCKDENMWNYDPRVSKKTDIKENHVPKESEDTGEITITTEALSNMETHLSFSPSKTQEEYYQEKGSPESILQYVRLPGKTFGEKYAEKICREHFKMDSRTDSSHDHTKLSKTIEQKSARFGGNGAGWKWQHIEMKHEFDHLLITGLEFQGFQFYIAPRANVERLIEEGVITGQGKRDSSGVAQPQQAYWFEKSDFSRKGKKMNDYFTHLTSEKSLVDYIQNTIS